MTSSMPWWRSDVYDDATALPQAFHDHAGPKGVALVKAWPDGRTQQGWGLLGPKDDINNGFARRYPRGEFNDRRVLYGYDKEKWNFAIVMRSVQLVCIDIDGKNGGLEHAKKLGMLPPTLSETSKSGDGYHLFYLVAEPWTDDKGFGELADRIGLEQGVDIRAVGCVYHHPQQRWNGRPVVALPKHLLTLLKHREQKITAETKRIETVLANDDPMEVLMMHDELVAELEKPIPAGRRNNTLFAIGNKMRMADVPDWDEKLKDRAHQVGLDANETLTLVANIERYGANVSQP